MGLHDEDGERSKRPPETQTEQQELLNHIKAGLEELAVRFSTQCPIKPPANSSITSLRDTDDPPMIAIQHNLELSGEPGWLTLNGNLTHSLHSNAGIGHFIQILDTDKRFQLLFLGEKDTDLVVCFDVYDSKIGLLIPKSSPISAPSDNSDLEITFDLNSQDQDNPKYNSDELHILNLAYTALKNTLSQDNLDNAMSKELFVEDTQIHIENTPEEQKWIDKFFKDFNLDTVLGLAGPMSTFLSLSQAYLLLDEAKSRGKETETELRLLQIRQANRNELREIFTEHVMLKYLEHLSNIRIKYFNYATDPNYSANKEITEELNETSYAEDFLKELKQHKIHALPIQLKTMQYIALERNYHRAVIRRFDLGTHDPNQAQIREVTNSINLVKLWDWVNNTI